MYQEVLMSKQNNLRYVREFCPNFLKLPLLSFPAYAGTPFFLLQGEL